MNPETVVRSIRICVAYAKGYMEQDTLQAWPYIMHHFKATIWPELLAGKPKQSTERVQ